MARPDFDAIVLAGGRARRLGGASKPDVEVGGVALLDHALAAVAGAAHVVVVGPPQVARPGIATVLEDPPDGGPVAGLAAGLDALPADGPDIVVVLACDVPGAGRVLPALLAAAEVTGSDGARMIGADGRPQHLVAAYRRTALRLALDALPAVRGAAMHALVGGLRLVDVADDEGATADADTWADVERLDATLSDRIDP
ncbi:molybdenum cofactor guanylyltransferase [Cellulomonas sp. Root485]|uniref:molybdenum cofactor guanylyltransferase n=1 Tax=Cellulomonas sp. Root485 TaxID=1736546 RepID=UPI001F33AD52|nr:NTP transferase domain-containing protein [Cellulomonas sp. Root485]